MTIALVADRAAAALLMLAAGILLTWPARARRTRAAWLALVGLGASYGLALNLQPVNFPNSNFAHYYLGAKYPVPYMETYRLLHAGEGRPQIGMRDLERPVDRRGDVADLGVEVAVTGEHQPGGLAEGLVGPLPLRRRLLQGRHRAGP